MLLPDSLRDALGQVIAAERRQWQRDRELIEAQARLAIAELRAEIAELRQAFSEKVDARLATLKDGEPGKSVTLDDVAPMIAERVQSAVALAVPDAVARVDVGRLVRDAVADAVSAIPVPWDGRDIDPADVRQMVNDAVSAIPPAKDGKDVDPAEVMRMVAEVVAALPLPKDGRDADPVDIERAVNAEFERRLDVMVARAVDAIPKPVNGKDAAPVDPVEIERMVAAAVDAIPRPKDGEPGRIVDHAEIDAMIYERVAESAPPLIAKAVAAIVDEKVQSAVDALPPPQRGEPGPMGALPTVDEWQDRVYRGGDVVTSNGSLFQAVRDTGKPPDHQDWRCIVRGGKDGVDGRPFRVRELWSIDKDYQALDVVALNGSAFVARVDNPGPCPGSGWQLLSARGKTGKTGDRSTVKGDRGPPGPSVVSMSVDGEGLLTLTNADGETVKCDLYPVLAKIAG